MDKSEFKRAGGMYTLAHLSSATALLNLLETLGVDPEAGVAAFGGRGIFPFEGVLLRQLVSRTLRSPELQRGTVYRLSAELGLLSESLSQAPQQKRFQYSPYTELQLLRPSPIPFRILELK